MSTDLTDSETWRTDGTVFGGIFEYTGSSASIDNAIFFQQHLCDREPNRRPMMRVDDERSKCDAAGANIQSEDWEAYDYVYRFF